MDKKDRYGAEDYRYGVWGGCPKGVPKDTNRCAWEIWNGFAPGGKQCSRKRGHGPEQNYCKQHARIHFGN